MLFIVTKAGLKKIRPAFNIPSYYRRYRIKSAIIDFHIKQRATAEGVATTIYQAATDGKQQLRYIIGADAQFYIDGKMNNSDEEYVRLMRGYFIEK